MLHGKRKVASKNRAIGFVVAGERDPEVVEVCQDVYQILVKMLESNQQGWLRLLGSTQGFEFQEVRFLANLLGVQRNLLALGGPDCVDLWISED